MQADVFRAWVGTAARAVEEQRDHLTQLDAAIGDADHGVNLARGFAAVLTALEAATPATPGAVLTLTGSTLISKVGGASGPLYGVAFRRAGKALGDAADVDLPALAAALDAIGADMPLSGDLLVMVNGMGGTPLLELYVLFNEVQRYLEGKGARIARNLVGNYITSLEMQGFSVTVCLLTDTLTRLWDAPVDTPALRWGR